MSFLGRLLGGKSWDELEKDGQAAFDSGDFGQAKLVYERALDRAEEAPSQVRERLSARITESRDRIAAARIAEAETLLSQGMFELALAELDGALDVVASEELAKKGRELAVEAERRAADQATEGPPAEATVEERFLALTGSWDEGQTKEYERYGDPLHDALLELMTAAEAAAEKTDETLDRTVFAGPVAKLEAIADAAGNDAVYLHFELGRARVAAGRPADGRASLERFLERLPHDAGGDARLFSHFEIARLADEGGDQDRAIAALGRAVEELPEDPRAYLALGQYLRRHDCAAEAVDVLESAMAVVGDGLINWRILEELGLAEVAREQPERAVEPFEQVLAYFTSRKSTDFPSTTAVPLARIYEAQKRPERAADIYRMLANGNDVDRRLEYLREAARLLVLSGARAEAERALTRGLQIAREMGNGEAQGEFAAALQAARDGSALQTGG